MKPFRKKQTLSKVCFFIYMNFLKGKRFEGRNISNSVKIGGVILWTLLRRMVDEVNEREHLTPLLNGASMTVQFVQERSSIFLVVENGKLTLKEKNDEKVDATIMSEPEVMKSLILGEIKLREAYKNNLLKLNSTFRTSLFLETLFKLSISKWEESLINNHVEIKPQRSEISESMPLL